MSRFNLKLVFAIAVVALASTACKWTDPVGPTTCVGTVDGDDAAGVAFWQSGYAQPTSWDDDGYWYDGWGNPIGWSSTEDSDICVVLRSQPTLFSPTTGTSVVWVDQPPVPMHLEVSE